MKVKAQCRMIGTTRFFSLTLIEEELRMLEKALASFEQTKRYHSDREDVWSGEDAVHYEQVVAEISNLNFLIENDQVEVVNDDETL